MEGGNFELPELESNCSSIDGDFEESDWLIEVVAI